MTGVLVALAALAALLLALVGFFAAQIMVSLPHWRSAPPPMDAPRFAVLVPAHDEARVIGATLSSVLAGCRAEDRVLVVADNCADDTAAIAAAFGVGVTERHDPERRGKGYALEHGLALIRRDWDLPVVIVVDADCVVADDALARLAARALATGRPVQGDYQMTAPPGAGLATRLGVFAFRVKNHARALGCARLGLTSPLAGSGMAFPTPLLASAHLGTAEIVEDLVLTVELTRAGTAPVFCPDARITSLPPATARGRRTQRERWERGYLSVLRRHGVALLRQGVARRSPTLFFLGADIAVPPLALLCLVTVMVFGLGVLGGWVSGTWLAAAVAAGTLALLVATVGVAWLRYGQDLLAPLDVAYFPIYVLAKIPSYLRMIGARRPDWVKTERG